MRQNWLSETYNKIKQSRDARLSYIVTLLAKKAADDAEIAEALRLLRVWGASTGQFEGIPNGQNQDGEEWLAQAMPQDGAKEMPSDLRG